jgi:hypothetical protein
VPPKQPTPVPPQQPTQYHQNSPPSTTKTAHPSTTKTAHPSTTKTAHPVPPKQKAVVLARCGSSHLQPQHSGLRQEDDEFKASLGYIARPCLKKQSKTKPVLSVKTSISHSVLWGFRSHMKATK